MRACRSRKRLKKQAHRRAPIRNTTCSTSSKTVVFKQREFTFYARKRGIVEDKPLDANNARVVGEYMANVEWARRNKDYDRLLHFEGRVVHDMTGAAYELEHDLRVIEALEKRADDKLRDKTANPYVKIVLYARAA